MSAFVDCDDYDDYRGFPDGPPYKDCDNPGAHMEHVWRDGDRGLFECDGCGLQAPDAESGMPYVNGGPVSNLDGIGGNPVRIAIERALGTTPGFRSSAGDAVLDAVTPWIQACVVCGFPKGELRHVAEEAETFGHLFVEAPKPPDVQRQGPTTP